LIKGWHSGRQSQFAMLSLARSTTMTTSSNGSGSESQSETFERGLATLLHESFAGGTEIEGTWEVTSSSDLVPDWRIDIEKTSSAVPPDNGGDFVDE